MLSYAQWLPWGHEAVLLRLSNLSILPLWLTKDLWKCVGRPKRSCETFTNARSWYEHEEVSPTKTLTYPFSIKLRLVIHEWWPRRCFDTNLTVVYLGHEQPKKNYVSVWSAASHRKPYVGLSSNSFNLFIGQRRRAVARWLNPREDFSFAFVIGGSRKCSSVLSGMYPRAVYLIPPVSSCRDESACELSYIWKMFVSASGNAYSHSPSR
jgi:hypothetical protein